jgi:hypothetical protein
MLCRGIVPSLIMIIKRFFFHKGFSIMYVFQTEDVCFDHSPWWNYDIDGGLAGRLLPIFCCSKNLAHAQNLTWIL